MVVKKLKPLKDSKKEDDIIIWNKELDPLPEHRLPPKRGGGRGKRQPIIFISHEEAKRRAAESAAEK